MKKLLSIIIFTNSFLGLCQLTIFGTLPPEITESSGLEYGNGQIFSHNDSGDSTVFYEIYSNNGIATPYYLSNASHLDWEDISLSADNKHLYIGDTGSNNFFFEREYRTIYKVPMKDGIPTDSIQPITFNFEDYSSTSNHFNFDCEAFMVKEENLYFFTKNYGSSGYSKIYRINASDTLQTAVLLDSIPTTHRVTAVDCYLDEIAILTEGSVILGELDDDKFSIHKTILIPFAKYEGMCYRNESNLLLTKDGFGNSIYNLSLEDHKDTSEVDVFVGPNNLLTIIMDDAYYNTLLIHNTNGQLIYEEAINTKPEYLRIDLSTFSSTIAVISLIGAEEKKSIKFFIP